MKRGTRNRFSLFCWTKRKKGSERSVRIDQYGGVGFQAQKKTVDRFAFGMAQKKSKSKKIWGNGWRVHARRRENDNWRE